nr:cytochrome P450 [Fodinicola feengrottensis]
MGELALSVTATALFRAEIGKQAVQEVHRWLPVIVAGLLPRVVAPDGWERVPTPGNRRFTEARRRLRAIVEDVIESYRVSAGNQRDDLLSALLTARYDDTGEPMSAEQLRDEVITILMSGTETTASALSWMFHQLAENPEVERRMHAELDTVLAGRAVTHADIERRLDYTGQVLRETLRRHSPLWFVMRRTTGPVDLAGVRIPVGSQVIYSLAALHRDPAVFAAPMVFDPDRWAPGRPVPDRQAFQPFSSGRHKCIGESFAWAEMTIAAATVAARWRLRPVPGRRIRERTLATLRPSTLLMIAEPRFATTAAPTTN